MSIYTYPPATPEQIAELERHAKVKLPEQYLQFLSKHAGLVPDSMIVGSTFVAGDSFLKILASVGADYENLSLNRFYPLEAVIEGESTLFKENGRSSTARLFREVLSHPFIFAQTDFGELAFNADGVDQSVYYVEVVNGYYDLETAQQWTCYATQEEHGGQIIPTDVAQRVANSFDEFYQMWLGTLRDDIRFYPVLCEQERERLLPMVKDLNPRTQALGTVKVLYSLNDAYGYINNPVIQERAALALVALIPDEGGVVDEASEEQIDALERFVNHFYYTLELNYILGKSFAELREEAPRLINLLMRDVMDGKKYYLFASLRGYAYFRYYQFLAMLFLLFDDNDVIKKGTVLSLQNLPPHYMDYLLKATLERLTGAHFEVSSTSGFNDHVENNLKKIIDHPQRTKAEIDHLILEYLDNFEIKFSHTNNRHSINSSHPFFAYEAALVVAILNLDDSAFRDHVRYPKDLVDYYRQHHQK